MATTEDWSAHAVEQLESAGKRSSVRRAIVEKLGAQECAVSAVDLDDQLRADGQRVGRATVYRTLEKLMELGLVERLDLGVAGTRYEATRHGPDHHHHLVCDRCGEVVPFADKRLEKAIEQVAKDLDYDVVGHEVVLRGRCGTCDEPQ